VLTRECALAAHKGHHLQSLRQALAGNKAPPTHSQPTCRFSTRLAGALQEVELSRVADDDYVHFGDVLQLVHIETSSVVACDPSDADSRPGELACAATAATHVTAPCARNSLILLRYTPPVGSPPEPEYGDDSLRYGQKVQLAAHPSVFGEEPDAGGGPRPLCLFSKPVSTTHHSKYSHQQLVGFTYRAHSFDTVWEVVTPDPAQRGLSIGVEVFAGAPVLLMHCATQKPLIVESQRYPTDFGVELELTARISANQGVKSVCEMTTRGLLRGSLPKSESAGSCWTLMPGTTVAQLPPARARLGTGRGASVQTVDAATLEAVHSVVQQLTQRSGGVEALERKLITWSSAKQRLAADGGWGGSVGGCWDPKRWPTSRSCLSTLALTTQRCCFCCVKWGCWQPSGRRSSWQPRSQCQVRQVLWMWQPCWRWCGMWLVARPGAPPPQPRSQAAPDGWLHPAHRLLCRRAQHAQRAPAAALGALVPFVGLARARFKDGCAMYVKAYGTYGVAIRADRADKAVLRCFESPHAPVSALFARSITAVRSAACQCCISITCAQPGSFARR
jgi:hypothetical protein